MDHMPTAGGERVRDQPPVAAVPVALRAHDGGSHLARERLEAREATGELGAIHVVGVTAKGGDPPGVVRRVRPRSPPTAELLAEPLVADSHPPERGAEGLAGELRMPARAGK